MYFLNVMGRNSLKSKKIYELGLIHFQNFLNYKHNGMQTIETIIEAVLKKSSLPSVSTAMSLAILSSITFGCGTDENWPRTRITIV